MIKNNVNHPTHYNQGSLETIDMLKGTLTKEQYTGFLKGNVLKYVSRTEYKGKTLEDYNKAKWYLDKLIDLNIKK